MNYKNVNVDVHFNERTRRYIFNDTVNNAFDSQNQKDEYYNILRNVMPKLEILIFLYKDILRIRYNVSDVNKRSSNVNEAFRRIKKYIKEINTSQDKEIYFLIENQEFSYTIAVRDTSTSLPKEAILIPDELKFKDKIEFDSIYDFLKTYGGKSILYKNEFKEMIIENNVKCVINVDIDLDNERLEVEYFDKLSKSAKPKQMYLPLNLKCEILYFEQNYAQEYERVDSDKIIKIDFKNRMINIFINHLTEILKKSSTDQYTFISSPDIRNKIYSIFLKSKNKNFETYTYIADLVRMFYNKHSIRINKYEDSPKNVFDYIVVDINVNSIGKSREEVFKIIKENSKFLQKRALNLVKNSKKFQKYEVPIEYLKVRDVFYTKDSMLEVVFELKEESKEIIE